MKKEKTIRKVYGLSREDEEKQLADIIAVAQENLERTEKYIKEKSEDLKDMIESYDTRDKEIIAIWRNTKAQFQENKQDLLRCLKARNKPYFGRIDFKDPKVDCEESYYIGRVGIAKNGVEPLVIDWRAPLASVYYENTIGECTYEVKNQGIHKIDLKRKRTYEIANDKLVDFFDSDVVANDDLLTKYLAKSKKAVLGEIIGTIQKEQNIIIRTSPKTNMIVQGVAGSGKTTVAMHRISYILYNYEMFQPKDFYVIGSNRILLNYITSVLPDLDVYGISQMTMEELFIRLLYEDWEPKIHKVGALDRKDTLASQKGSYEWFHALENYCLEYERTMIPMDQVEIPKNKVVLLTRERIEKYINENPMLSMQTKINTLNEILKAKLDNELIGKSVSYSKEEKKELYRNYKFHFGKDEWKGSIFELYDAFLESQRSKGYHFMITDHTYDIYDLAALAYLYKRIKETDGIREASHIIIDEAQDFGMMAYAVLKYCLRWCTYTIMGDVSQNIYYEYGLNDWEELKKLILTGEYDSFGLLKKSYRNTVEISNFATEILRHGNFSIYPVEPIIRHGNEVLVTDCENEEKMIQSAVDIILGWQKDGHETIAVICRDEEEAHIVSEQLGKKVTITDSNVDTATFEEGVMVLPVEYTKGLEFDAVLLYDPSNQKYPAKDQYVKLLYVAATRALHELVVIHQGDLSDLIAKPVSEEKRMTILKDKYESKRVGFVTPVYEISEEKKEEDLERYLKRTQKNYFGSQLDQSSSSTKTEPIQKEKMIRDTNNTENLSSHAFNAIVDPKSLTKKGHSRIDCAIRWVKKSERYVDLASNYGVLRLIPVSETIIRVQFHRGQASEFEQGCWEYESDQRPSFTLRKSTTQYEVATTKIAIRIDKSTGAMIFYDKSGGVLLKEDEKLPRQVETSTHPTQIWMNFVWPKNEKIYAKGILADDLQRVNTMARYISFGGKKLRMPLLLSDKGYGLGIAATHDTIFCDIPMYGRYVYTEEMKQIDYYFIYGGKMNETIEMYQEITRG